SQRATLDAGQDRVVIDGGDADGARGDVAQVVAGRAVVHLEADRARGGAGVVAAVEIGHRTQRGLVVGHSGGAGEGQHSRAGVVTARDAVLISEAQHVLATGETGRDGDGS